MGNEKNVCLSSKQTAVINDFFGKMLTWNQDGEKDTTFSGLAGDPSQVCYDDVVAAVDYFEKKIIYQGEGHHDDFSRQGFVSKLESLYYKEGGKFKKPEIRWYDGLFSNADAADVLTKEDAAVKLWKHIRGYANLGDVERLRLSNLDSVRKAAITALSKGVVAGGIEKLTDDELCGSIVRKTPESGYSGSAKFGYYLAYLDEKKKYKDKALSYVFGSYDKLYPSELRETLTLYGWPITPTGIKALYRKYPDASLATWFSFFGMEGLHGFCLERLKDKRYSDTAKEEAVKLLIKDRRQKNVSEELLGLAFGVIEYASDKEFFIKFVDGYNRNGKYDGAIVSAVIRYGLGEEYLEGRSLDLATVEAIYKENPKTPITVWRYFRKVEGIDKFYSKLLDSNAYSNEEKYELLTKLWSKELYKYALENHLDLFTPEQACETLAHQPSETAPNAETIRKIALNSETPLASIGNVEFVSEALLIELTLQGKDLFEKRLQFALEHRWSATSIQEHLWTELTKGRSEVEVFGAVVRSGLDSNTTATTIDFIRNIIVPAITGRDGDKVNKLFGWIGDRYSPVLADIITKGCTPDDIVWLSDIQNASDFAKRHLADSLAEVYLREGDFVKLFGISSYLNSARNDFWKRLFTSVIQYKDKPRLEHVLCLDVAIKYDGDSFWAVTNTERDKNINDATVMISNHLEGEGPKFYYSKGDNVGRGICGLMGEELLKKAIGMMQDRDSSGTVKERDGDGVILLRRVLEYYAYRARIDIEYCYKYRDRDYPVDERGEAFFNLMRDYLETGLPELHVFSDMDEETRKSLVESNATILSVMLKHGGGIDKPHEYMHRMAIKQLAEPLCVDYRPSEQNNCYSDKGLKYMLRLNSGSGSTFGRF